MRGYKVFENDMTCRGFQYEVGKEYEMDGEPWLCERGFHFCKTMANVFNYYLGEGKRYAEVEAYGDVVEGDDKCVTNKIRILREIPHQEAVDMTNTGNCNTGNRNTGNCNTGNRNTGDWNTGNCNTGNWNTGNRNTGNCNTGNCNTGNCNTGDWNTGNCNTGNCNTGNCNTGNWNTGDWNTGNWNTTRYSAGCFNTEQQKAILFNKPSDWTLKDWWESDARYILSDAPQEIDVVEWIYTYDMTDAEKEAHPEYETTGGYLKVTHEAPNRQEWWDKLPEADKKNVMSIPNFDAEVFKQCTGIEVRTERLIDGDALIRKFKTASPMAVDGRARQIVEDMPTIEERKTGKWERHYSRPNVYADLCWHCSNCGYKTPDNWANKWKFCPNCGARMQEGEQL